MKQFLVVLGAVVVIALVGGLAWIVFRWREVLHGPRSACDLTAIGIVLFIWIGLARGKKRRREFWE